MLTAILFIIVGFVLLMWSADKLVDNATILATNLGISTFLIGVLIIGFGTSAPELFVSAMAAIRDKGNLALGNALGSNITNIGLVLGFAAFIHSLSISKSILTRDIPIMAFFGLVSVALLYDAHLSRLDGLILSVLLVAYLIWSAKSSSQSELDSDSISSNPISSHGEQSNTASALIWSIASIILLVGSSKLLVDGSETIALYFGVSELIIGLTIVAIGTSLPELAAAIAAARKNDHQMIIGNIIGSNVFNTLGVLGISGLIRSTQIQTQALWRDFPVMFAFISLFFIFGLTRAKLSRAEGGILVLGYLAYICYLISISIS